MPDITNMTALEQSEAIAGKSLSARELMQATLEQISKCNPSTNAIVSLRDEAELLAEAEAADNAPSKGWLHGIPMAVKDLANAKGLTTTMGSPIHKDNIAVEDDLMVARMRDAGALVIGKTNTPEAGLGSHTFNTVFGVTSNPYDTALSAGGSSGGAAAALASRMLSVADGSDMMGSLRNPAAWNNVYGFRPTFGRVPAEASGDTFLHQLATLGPMARNPADLAALLDTQTGLDPRQPHGASVAPTLPSLDTSVKNRRIGWLGDWGGAFAMEAGLMEHSETAIPQLEALGLNVEPVAPPFSAEAIWDSWTTLRSWQVGAGLEAPYNHATERALLKPEAIWEIERGLAYSAMDVHRASVIRSQWFTACAELFKTYDALILPTTQLYPFPKEWAYPTEIAGQTMDTYHRWMQIVTPIGLLGLPCINLPIDLSSTGLPAGLQVFGPRNSDGALMQIGQAWHAAYKHSDVRPSLA